MTRFSCFIGVLLIACTGPVWLMIIAMLAYALFYSAPELIIATMFLDALFMTSVATVPVYTLTAAGGLILLELLKPLTILKSASQQS